MEWTSLTSTSAATYPHIAHFLRFPFGRRVTEVLIEDGGALGLSLTNGLEERAACVIATADAPALYKQLVPERWRRRWTNRRIAAGVDLRHVEGNAVEIPRYADSPVDRGGVRTLGRYTFSRSMCLIKAAI